MICSCADVSLCCLMTPGLSKDIWCHARPYSFLCMQITRSGIRQHVKWAVSLVIADGHFIFFRACVGMHGLGVCPKIVSSSPTLDLTSVISRFQMYTLFSPAALSVPFSFDWIAYEKQNFTKVSYSPQVTLAIVKELVKLLQIHSTEHFLDEGAASKKQMTLLGKSSWVVFWVGWKSFWNLQACKNLPTNPYTEDGRMCPQKVSI